MLDDPAIRATWIFFRPEGPKPVQSLPAIVGIGLERFKLLSFCLNQGVDLPAPHLGIDLNPSNGLAARQLGGMPQ